MKKYIASCLSISYQLNFNKDRGKMLNMYEIEKFFQSAWGRFQ